ncbi:DNA internalization-related competence protein ComEC/Rec2 [Dechloromonas sp. ZY10]|uniref:DNA internalization-related competence protein ComEC/Rec2 n=1 Tax=Dechloromonas aquae TaxID=2664436 RepID=UPI0035279511
MVPIVLPALALTSGICFLQMLPVLPPWPWRGLLVAVLLGLLCLGCCGSGRAGQLVRLLLACGLGFVWAGWQAADRLAERLDPVWEGRDLQVIGVVATLPQYSERGQRFEFVLESRLTVENDRRQEIPARQAGLPARILLSHYWRGGMAAAGDAPEPIPLFRAGERWQLSVRLKQPHGNANPGSFDYEAWLFERGLRATGSLRPGPAVRLSELVAQPRWWLERWRDSLRQQMLAQLPPADYPGAGILVALAMGDQRSIGPGEWQVFSRTGTTHLMSISGLHVTMLAALCAALVTAGWRRHPALVRCWPAQQAGWLAAALAGCGYALLAGFAVPAQRTAMMLLVACLAGLLQRQPAPSRVLALALVAVLLYDPWAVRAPGFWLSFGAVAALFWIAQAQPAGSGWRQRLLGWGRVQWAATLASLPILLLLFQQLSLVSPLANALAIPLVSWAIAPLALAAALLGSLPGGETLAAMTLQLAHLLLAGLLLFLAWCAQAPLWQPPAPPWPVALLAGVGVAIALLPRGLPGRGLGLCLVLPALYWPAPRPQQGSVWVDFLDVGQGLAVVVRTARHNLVYDPGPLYGPAADAGERVLLPFLRFSGVDRVHRLVISHRDSDHAGGTASLLAALPVEEVSSSFASTPSELCRGGERWQWDGVDFAFLHPPPEAYTVDRAKPVKSNHLSCVLRITAGGHHLLLTGDIEAVDEARLLAVVPHELLADVLLVPHHGSKTSSSPEFIAAVAPLHAVFTVGYRNRFGHPRPEILARYTAHGTQTWRSDRDGMVSIELGPSGARLSAWREQRQAYWHRVFVGR